MDRETTIEQVRKAFDELLCGMSEASKKTLILMLIEKDFKIQSLERENQALKENVDYYKGQAFYKKSDIEIRADEVASGLGDQ